MKKSLFTYSILFFLSITLCQGQYTNSISSTLESNIYEEYGVIKYSSRFNYSFTSRDLVIKDVYNYSRLQVNMDNIGDSSFRENLFWLTNKSKSIPINSLSHTSESNEILMNLLYLIQLDQKLFETEQFYERGSRSFSTTGEMFFNGKNHFTNDKITTGETMKLFQFHSVPEKVEIHNLNRFLHLRTFKIKLATQEIGNNTICTININDNKGDSFLLLKFSTENRKDNTETLLSYFNDNF